MRRVSRSVSGDLPWRKNCHLHTCLWPKWSPHPLQGNMCCLGRYKGVILLLGTSPLRSHFISPFQPPQKPLFDLIFQSMTASNRSDSVYFHLENTFSVGGVAEDGSGEQGVLLWKGLRQVSLSHANVLLQGIFHSAWLSVAKLYISCAQHDQSDFFWCNQAKSFKYVQF